MAEPLEWNRYQVFVENRSPAKFSDIPGVVRSLNDRPSKSPIESGCRFGETYEDDKESSRKLNTSDAFIGIISFAYPFFCLDRSPLILIGMKIPRRLFKSNENVHEHEEDTTKFAKFLRSVPGEDGTERRRDGVHRLQDGGGE